MSKQVDTASQKNDPLTIVLYSSLYPNSVKPGHGIFVETRLLQLLKIPNIRAKVIAPVPWFPGLAYVSKEHARWSRVPRVEMWNGVEVFHPRYLHIPKFGMSLAPLLQALGSIACLRQLVRSPFRPDVIDAHYVYPDGVAAGLLSTWLRIPFVMTARGTDINVLPKFALPRWWIQSAMRKAQALIGVSAALCNKMQTLGAPANKLHVLRNGVDLQRFQLLDKTEARQHIKLPNGRWMLSVAALRELKGQHLMIEALQQMPEWNLLIVGEGEEGERLRQLANKLGVANRVRFEGAVPQQNLSAYYAAADVFVLASSREGWPNVLLESMACGTAVVATPVSGVPDIICAPEAGELMAERSAQEIVTAVNRLMARQASLAPQATRQYAAQYDWATTSAAQQAIFQTIKTTNVRVQG